MAMRAPFVRSAYNYDQDRASEEAGFFTPEPSLTQQSQAEEADINTIVRRFGVTGVLPENIRVPLTEDFSEGVIDFRTAMDAIAAAKFSFSQLSSDVRERFGNDPEKFIIFCENPDNVDEMIKMGLAVKKPEPVESPPAKVEIVNPEALVKYDDNNGVGVEGGSSPPRRPAQAPGGRPGSPR